MNQMILILHNKYINIMKMKRVPIGRFIYVRQFGQFVINIKINYHKWHKY